MSSFGAYDISVKDAKIDYLVSSSNKCLQGVPGFSFIIANKEVFMKTECLFYLLLTKIIKYIVYAKFIYIAIYIEKFIMYVCLSLYFFR